ncbi:MAG TPA: hypothetical protein O0X41_01815, partial [Methanocorpusculum sp.]|nr:hypothetical protein [Methanocorpusculum sp.]
MGVYVTDSYLFGWCVLLFFLLNVFFVSTIRGGIFISLPGGKGILLLCLKAPPLFPHSFSVWY